MSVASTSRSRIAPFASLVAGAMVCSACADEHRSGVVDPHVDKRIGLDEMYPRAIARAQDHLQTIRSSKLALTGKGDPFYELTGSDGKRVVTVYVTDTGSLLGTETKDGGYDPHRQTRQPDLGAVGERVQRR